MNDALEQWKTGAQAMRLENANLVQEFQSLAQLHILQPLAAASAGNNPNVEALKTWLGKISLTPNSSLFKSDPTAKLNVK